MRLAELAEINPRAIARPSPTALVSFLGMAGVDAETGRTSSGEDRVFGEVSKGYTNFADGDLLVAKITPCFENGKIAQAQLAYDIGVGSTEFHVIRPRPSVLDTRYALHILRSPQVRVAGERRMTGSAGQRRVPEAFLANLEIPLPPIEEQRRIANVLDRADALRAKRRGALACLDVLTQSIFLDMFGADNLDWPSVTVADLVDQSAGGIRTGPFGSQLLHSEFVDSGVAVLGIDNAVNNRFAWSERRYITHQKYAQLSRYTVHPGDVLITIMGTCGRAAIVPDGIPEAINTKHLCCISLDQSVCLPEYLHAYFLRHPAARDYLVRTAKGAIMSGLNMGIIKAMPVVVPPLSTQREFVAQVRATESIEEVCRAQAIEFDAMFESLQQRAFAGQL